MDTGFLGTGPLDTARLLNRRHPLARGLLGWWLVVPHLWGGGKWFDLARTFHGTLTNMSSTSGWRSTTRPGGWGHLKFDGSNDEVDVPHSSLFEGSQYTWSAWSYYTTLGAQQTWSSQGTFDGGTGWNWGFEAETDGTMRLFLGGGGGGNRGDTVSSTITTNTWQHQAIVFDGTATGDANRLKYYLNGSNLSLTFSGSMPSSLNSNSGGIQFGTFGGLGRYFTGNLDDIRIYNRPLSATEVTVLYRNSRLGYPRLLRRLAPWLSQAAPVTAAGVWLRPYLAASELHYAEVEE